MNFRLLDCVIGRTSCRSKSVLMKFRFLSKKGFCSDPNKDDANNSELRIKKLLNSASPLRPELTHIGPNPYPRGTIYQEVGADDVEEKNPANTSIILFPGQGNQFVGMAKNLLKYPMAVQMFEAASEILGYDLLKVCNEGPEEKLNSTEYCQPATLVCSLALLEKLKDEKPWAISNCVGTCGYSLGEISALTFAGCFSFETAVSLVKLRAKAMEYCSQMTPGGMMTVFYRPFYNLSGALSDAIEHCKSKQIENPQCSVASYLFPNCKVIGGNTEALNFIIDNAKKYGIIKTSKLNVSGAFHTLLMKDAVEPFAKKLKNSEVRNPIITVYSSVTGKSYSSAATVIKVLPSQIYRPVRWQQVLTFIYEREKGMDFPKTYECGPGMSLIPSLKKVNARAGATSYSVKL